MMATWRKHRIRIVYSVLFTQSIDHPCRRVQRSVHRFFLSPVPFWQPNNFTKCILFCKHNNSYSTNLSKIKNDPLRAFYLPNLWKVTLISGPPVPANTNIGPLSMPNATHRWYWALPPRERRLVCRLSSVCTRKG